MPTYSKKRNRRLLNMDDEMDARIQALLQKYPELTLGVLLRLIVKLGIESLDAMESNEIKRNSPKLLLSVLTKQSSTEVA